MTRAYRKQADLPLSDEQSGLVASYWPLAWKVAGLYMRDHADRLDAAVDGALAAAREPQIAEWTARIVRLRVSAAALGMRLARKRLRRTSDRTFVRAEPIDRHDDLRQADDRDEVAFRIDQLSPLDRRIALATFDGLTQVETSARLGVSQAFVSLRVRRLRSLHSER